MVKFTSKQKAENQGIRNKRTKGAKFLMRKNQLTKEKTCAFYASDYHFEMISLPYIEKNLENNKDIIVLTENNLEDTMRILISNVNLKEEKKQKIIKINWKNDDLNKFKQIKEDVDENKEIIIFIKGNKNYINNINENIKKWVEKNENVKIIDCYNIEEVNGEMVDIIEKYQNVLSVRGETKIENK